MSQVSTKLVDGRRIRWDDELATEAYARGWWVQDTLADALRDAAERTPHRTVMIDGDVRLDCQELCQQATMLAHALHARMPPSSVVSFMLPNWHEAAVIYLAATLAGMVANPILPSMRDRELRFILEDTDSRIIFAPAHFNRHDYSAMLRRVTAQLESPPDVVVVRDDAEQEGAADGISFASLLQPQPVTRGLPGLNPEAVRMILYTSGTTGKPKGVLHSHNSIHALICQIRDNWNIHSGDNFLVPSPIAHIGGSIYAFECPLLLGTTAVLMDRWDPAAAVALMIGERCTHMAGATPFLQQLLSAAVQIAVHQRRQRHHTDHQHVAQPRSRECGRGRGGDSFRPYPRAGDVPGGSRGSRRPPRFDAAGLAADFGTGAVITGRPGRGVPGLAGAGGFLLGTRRNARCVDRALGEKR